MEKTILGIVPGFMALSVVGKSMETIPKGWGSKGTKQVNTKKMIGSFVPIMVSVPMIKIVSTQVAAL